MTIQIPKKFSEVEEFNASLIDEYSILNSLEFYKDSDDFIIYNPLTSLQFNVDLSDLPVYEVKSLSRPRWDLISHQIYGTSQLWYILAQLNEVTNIITDVPSNGEYVYFLESDYINDVLTVIKENA